MALLPEDARRVLNDPNSIDDPRIEEVDGMWKVRWNDSYWNTLSDAPYEDVVAYAHTKDALDTVAAMNSVYAVVEKIGGDFLFVPLTGREDRPGTTNVWGSEDDARATLRRTPNGFLVRQSATPVEFIDD